MGDTAQSSTCLSMQVASFRTAGCEEIQLDSTLQLPVLREFVWGACGRHGAIVQLLVDAGSVLPQATKAFGWIPLCKAQYFASLSGCNDKVGLCGGHGAIVTCMSMQVNADGVRERERERAREEKREWARE